MKSIGAFVVLTLLFVSPSYGQTCTTSINKLQADVTDVKYEARLAQRQHFEEAVNRRVEREFYAVATPEGTGLCSTSTPAASLPLGDVNGVPDDVSGAARCALYCHNLDGCSSFNYFSKALTDGSQCQLFTADATACQAVANCQHYEFVGQKRSCRPTTGFYYMNVTKTYYQPVFQAFTWAQAQDYCHSLNPFSHLAIFRSMAEFIEVTAFLRTYQPSQAWACSSSASYGTDWSGWWVAKRKMSDDSPDATTCMNLPMFQSYDTNRTQVLPEEDWESQMWVAGAPNCAVYYKKAFTYEQCGHIAVNHLYQLNDLVCDYAQCALCQIDVK